MTLSNPGLVLQLMCLKVVLHLYLTLYIHIWATFDALRHIIPLDFDFQLILDNDFYSSHSSVRSDNKTFSFNMTSQLSRGLSKSTSDIASSCTSAVVSVIKPLNECHHFIKLHSERKWKLTKKRCQHLGLVTHQEQET